MAFHACAGQLHPAGALPCRVRPLRRCPAMDIPTVHHRGEPVHLHASRAPVAGCAVHPAPTGCSWCRRVPLAVPLLGSPRPMLRLVGSDQVYATRLTLQGDDVTAVSMTGAPKLYMQGTHVLVVLAIVPAVVFLRLPPHLVPDLPRLIPREGPCSACVQACGVCRAGSTIDGMFVHTCSDRLVKVWGGSAVFEGVTVSNIAHDSLRYGCTRSPPTAGTGCRLQPTALQQHMARFQGAAPRQLCRRQRSPRRPSRHSAPASALRMSPQLCTDLRSSTVCMMPVSPRHYGRHTYQSPTSPGLPSLSHSTRHPSVCWYDLCPSLI